MNKFLLILLIVVVCLASLILQSSVSAQAPSPAADGWQTETLSSSIQSQLELLLTRTIQKESSEDLATADALCAVLQADSLSTAREDQLVTVRRLKESFSPAEASELLNTQFPKLVQPLLRGPGEAVEGTRFRIKISRIKLDGDTAVARALLFATSNSPAGPVQLNATWQTTWILPNAESLPRLKSLAVLKHEEIYLKSQSSWFVDATAALFAGDQIFEQQIKFGMNDWLNRIERYAGSNIYTRHGLALGDVNGDGLDDLYLCQPGGLPNRLFLQQPDGRLVDRSAASRVDWLNDTRSALFVDLDNDGDQDLVVGTFVGAFLCRNNGRGVFERAGSLPGIGIDISSLSAVDYDNDGDLDLHVCVYHSDDRMNGRDMSNTNVYDLRSRGGMNRLYRNDIDRQQKNKRDWQFEDVTSAIGLEDGNQRYSLAAAWEDFDNDGDQDLYIANDFGINCLYQNLGGKFENVSAKLGVEDYGPGMSVAWGDYNRDGYPDLYVANMFSAAGNRVTRQSSFQVNAHGTSRESFQRFNKGNSLYMFNGKHFEELPGAAGAENALWAWSSLLADIDNDGWQDALVANGYITGPGGGDL